jgi:hypothetical protein
MESHYYEKRKALKTILHHFSLLDSGEVEFLTFEAMLLHCQLNANVSKVNVNRMIMTFIASKPNDYYIYEHCIYLSETAKQRNQSKKGNTNANV